MERRLACAEVQRIDPQVWMRTDWTQNEAARIRAGQIRTMAAAEAAVVRALFRELPRRGASGGSAGLAEVVLLNSGLVTAAFQ